MKKYYIGLLVLALLTLGLVGYTVHQGSLAKKDKATAAEADKIAVKLNSYVTKNNKIPANLQTVGVATVPKTIKYTRLSSERYEFCVTYQAASRGYNLSAAELAASAFYTRYAGLQGFDSGSYEQSELYLNSYGHKQGENCTKVKPYLNTYTDSDQTYCDPSYPYYSAWKDYCATINSSTLDQQTN
jgi:hypothetical protein